MFGFGKAFVPEKDIPSLAGKVIVITGGNTGLGKETVLQLAKHSPEHIFLAARTASKAEAAIEEVKKVVPAANITHLQLDLTSFESIKAAAKEFQSKSDRLDILLNNAGIMMTPYSKTKEGYEIQFGTNHVGHALFTDLLLPTLLKTAEAPGADVRVVNVSSAGHMLSPRLVYDQDALEKYHSAQRYGQSKLSNIYHARELARRYPSITATAIHPGVIVTDLYIPAGKTNFFAPYLFAVMKWFTPTVEGGAKNQLWAATAPKEEVRKGYYFTPVGSLSSGSFWYGRNAKMAEELWDWTAGQIKKHE